MNGLDKRNVIVCIFCIIVLCACFDAQEEKNTSVG